VLEYNTRFGDPETQVVLPRLADDLLRTLWDAATGNLTTSGRAPERAEHALCVVIAARGYPEAYPKGDVIHIPTALPQGVQVIHAGTARNAAGQLVTNGGRVLGVTAIAPNLRAAATAAYAACDAIECATKVFRRDIGAKQLNRR
jgi:phosphoribosylamine--glycine ligase